MGLLSLGMSVIATEEPATANAAATGYSVVGRIPGPDGGWDYSVVDAGTHRLYIGRDNGVAALDLLTRKWTPELVSGQEVHGIAVIGNTGTLMSTNGRGKSVTFFDGATGKTLGIVPIGREPDAAVFEQKTAMLAVMTKGGDVTLVDPQKFAAVASIAVGGKLEFAVSNGDGLVYVNVENTHQIAVVDVAARSVSRKIPLEGCAEPTGLAYDAASDLLISVCSNGVAKVVRAQDGKEVASLPIGKGADAAILDASRRRVFVPCGGSGTLSVLDLADVGDIKIAATVRTKTGSRTGAVDPSSGQVYLPAAKFGPPVPPNPWPSVVPGSFAVLIVADR
jgi:DNA-binding beta-propeller fold protein YncE